MTDAGPKPVEIELQRTKQLRIRWSDGGESVLPLVVLRRACPCAGCRAKREEATAGAALPVVQSPAEQLNMVCAEKVELVGHYALRLTWRDGHTAGIFDHALLRALGQAGDGPPESCPRE